jgi:hypothetical protein
MKKEHSQIQRVVLETSLKPFTQTDPDSIEQACGRILSQWHPLLDISAECSILFWVADGSEILTWGGDPSAELEWAKYIGFCNAEFRPYIGHTEDPRRQAILYRDDPSTFTYGDLATIISTFKRVAAEKYGQTLTAGATFDPGPEFARAEFKFATHPEIMRSGEETAIGNTVSMVRAWSVLAGDDLSYAAYPDGIPDNTPFGEFFWRQSRAFTSTLGFDYIWLSNGFGFSHFGWSALGENFDGRQFARVDYGQVAARILDFWQHYQRECSDLPVDVRGTNYSTGIDLASDCVPLDAIYAGNFLRAPAPNYPSGALNEDFGLEMVGYMTRIARLPGDHFPFRYYPNDPWFWQNPWWDLYQREPFDIYCPLSTGRLNDQGQIENPQVVEFLTIDTEKGDLDERCALEVIPHIRRAIDDFPDRAGLLTWVYPFAEYHQLASDQPERLDLPYFGDWFARSAINAGLPLNTVLSTDALPTIVEDHPEALSDSLLFSPVPFGEGDWEEALIQHVHSGGRVFFYGPLDLASPAMRQLLNLETGEGIEEECTLRLDLEPDPLVRWRGNRTFRHESILSAGPVSEKLIDPDDPHSHVHATLRQGAEERIYALTRRSPVWRGGAVSWIRGSSSFSFVDQRPREYPADIWNPAELARYLLASFGYRFVQERQHPGVKPVLNFVTRHRNAFIFSGFKADTTVVLRYAFPQGAPLLVGAETVIEDGAATYFLDKSFHKECRIFVRQPSGGVLSCKEKPPFPTGKERKLQVSGLQDADLVVYPPLERMDEVVFELDGQEVDIEVTGGSSGGRGLAAAHAIRREGDSIHLNSVTGVLSVNW